MNEKMNNKSEKIGEIIMTNLQQTQLVKYAIKGVFIALFIAFFTQVILPFILLLALISNTH